MDDFDAPDELDEPDFDEPEFDEPDFDEPDFDEPGEPEDPEPLDESEPDLVVDGVLAPESFEPFPESFEPLLLSPSPPEDPLRLSVR